MALRKRFSSLRVQVVALVLLGLLPAFLLLLAVSLDQRQRAFESARNEALALSRLIGSYQNQLIVNTEQTLKWLAASPEVRSGDPATCNALLNSVFSQLSGYLGVSVARPNGEVYCLASSKPPTTTLNSASQSYFQAALAAKEFALGGFALGRSSGKPNLTFGYPLLDSRGEVQAVIGAGLDIEAINREIARVNLPPEATLLVMDHKGKVLVRHPEPERWLGQDVTRTPLGRLVRAERDGSGEEAGLDGVRRIYGFAYVPAAANGGLHIAVGYAPATVYALVDRPLVSSLLGLGTAALLALLVVWLGTDRFVVNPVRRVVNAASQVRAGQLSTRTALTGAVASEFLQLGAAFDRMAEALQKREAENAQLLESERVSRARSEEASDRLARLHVLMEALAFPLTPQQLAETALKLGASLLGVSAGALNLAAPDGQTLDVFDYGFPGELVKLEGQAPLTASLPAAEVFNTGTPLWYESRATLAERFPQAAETLAAYGFEALVMLPLLHEQRCLGVLSFSFSQPRAFTESDRDFLGAVAQQVSQALERAHLRHAEREAFNQLQQLNHELEQRVLLRTQQLQTSNHKLLDSQSELRRLSRQLMWSIEEERKRIAREVHDQLGQALTGIKMDINLARRKIDSGQNPAALEQLKKTSGLLDQTIRDVRRIASELRPGLLDDLGLAAAIEWRLRDLEERSELKCHFAANNGTHRLDPEVTTAAYRILQEALTNIVRHAEASEVHVDLQVASDWLTLRVDDNGRGLPPGTGALHHSLGLMGMRERARQLGGVVEVRNGPHRGTRVTARLPLNGKREETKY